MASKKRYGFYTYEDVVNLLQAYSDERGISRNDGLEEVVRWALMGEQALGYLSQDVASAIEAVRSRASAQSAK